MGGEIREGIPASVDKKPGYQPQEPDLEQRKGLLQRILDKKLTKKQVVAEAAVILGTAATAATAILARAGGKSEQSYDVNTRGDVNKVQTIDSHPTIDATTIPGTNIPNPNTPTPEAPTQNPTEKPASTPTATQEVPTSTPTEKPAENPLFARYDSLTAKIRESNLPSDTQSDLLSHLEEYKSIEAVQGRLMKAYQGELGPDGRTPALLFYTSKTMPAINDHTPENQIFFLQNQEIIENELRPNVDRLNQNFKVEQLQAFMDSFSQKQNYVYGTGDLYFGANIPLKDYRYFVGDAEPGKINLDNLSAQQNAQFKTLENELGPIFGKFTVFPSKQFEGQNTGNGEIHINLSNKRSSLHEYTHATDPALNPQMLLRLDPGNAVAALTMREKALADEAYGIKYLDLDKLMASPSQVSPFEREIGRDSATVFWQNWDGVSDVVNASPHDFATVKSTGEKITDAKYKQLVDIETNPQRASYGTTREFLEAEKAKLDQLYETSDFYKKVIDMMRANPEGFDNLALWLKGPSSPAIRSNQGVSNYYNFLRNGADALFMKGLIEKDPKAKEFFSSLSANEQKELAASIITLNNAARSEHFAYANSISRTTTLDVPAGENPYITFYMKSIPQYRD